MDPPQIVRPPPRWQGSKASVDTDRDEVGARSGARGRQADGRRGWQDVGDDDVDGSAEGLLFGDDADGHDGQPGHVKQAEPDTAAHQIVRVVAAEQAASGDRTHLVVQLRPPHPAAVVAEAKELDGVRIRGARARSAWIHRLRALPPNAAGSVWGTTDR